MKAARSSVTAGNSSMEASTMQFVYRRISNALKFQQDDFMQALFQECQLKLSNNKTNSSDPLCFALVLDLAGNVLANELSIEDNAERTAMLRKLITETFHNKQLAVRALESMSRADFTKLKTEVLSCIIDELIPLRAAAAADAHKDITPSPQILQQQKEALTMEEILKRKDREIQNANALVMEMEERMKIEWEELKRDTNAIIAEMQTAHAGEISALEMEMKRRVQIEIDQHAKREREWNRTAEQREVDRIAQDQKRRQQQEWEAEQVELKWGKILNKREAEWKSERANLEIQLELDAKLRLEEAERQIALRYQGELDQAKQAFNNQLLALQHANAAENEALACAHKQNMEEEFTQWKQEFIAKEDEQLVRWKQEFTEEQHNANQLWIQSREQEFAQWKQEFTTKQQEKTITKQNELLEQWKREQEDLMETVEREWKQDQLAQNEQWKQEQLEETQQWKQQVLSEQQMQIEQLKLGFMAEQRQSNEEWKNQLLAEEAKLECDFTAQLTALQEEKTNAALQWSEQESILKQTILELQQSANRLAEQHKLDLDTCRSSCEARLAEQVELDEVLAKERHEVVVAAERQRSVMEKAMAIEAALKAQRVQFEEEKARTVNKLCVSSSRDDSAAPKHADLRMLLDGAQSVHRQLEAITNTLRSSAKQNNAVVAASPKRRLTQVSSSFHTPMEKRKWRTSTEEELSEAERLEARLLDEVQLSPHHEEEKKKNSNSMSEVELS